MVKIGKYLEVIVVLIERIFVDNDKIIIRCNKKFKDRDGVYCEVDVYVEILVNRKILKYVIECKEKSGKFRVELREVLDFYSKIVNYGIKGIIIIIIEFRVNVVKKVKNLGFDLYKIIENKELIV